MIITASRPLMKNSPWQILIVQILIVQIREAIMYLLAS